MLASTRALLTLTFTLSGFSVAMAQTSVDYLRDIKPILQTRCYACHGALKHEAGLRLDTGRFARQGGGSGAAVTPGEADNSPLLIKVSHKDLDQRMPPEGEPLSAAQIEALRIWITQGASSPDQEQPEPDPRQHWAFQPPLRPDVPRVAAEGIRNPIDAFIATALTREGLTAHPLAPKYVQLRRLYLDLIGLPPTREELQAFLADTTPTAYETVVDRLLNDARYGERWGRHWMDIWRYSDWYGRRHVPDVWNSAPQIWRWRDWIVASLNADHGYDRMLREMLAADEICPENDAATVATGYLIRNWYALNPNDWMRNTVEHTGKAFLALTFNCAHCHDHKYDPITQDDYFRLRAFFEPIDVRQDRVPGEADPGPFQEYDYSTLRKIQRLGAVRIYDKRPDASTWFYTGGDERNRVKERGSIPPGVPAFLAETAPQIETVKLPPQAWYPGLRPALHDALLAEARGAIVRATTEFAAAKEARTEVPQVLRDPLEQAESAYRASVAAALQAGRPGALVGRQSLLLDATNGRRVLYNRLPGLKALDDGTALDFELLILKDAHVNFQLAKDVVKGLTAGYIGLKQGRIISYQPGSFTEFDAGKYDFGGGQARFHVTLVIETAANRCLLTIRSVADDKLLVDRVPVALNNWNPVGDSTKAISLDCQTGGMAVFDEITITAPVPTEPSAATSAARLVTIDFESPVYNDGRDIAGTDGWSISSFSSGAATSVVSSSATNASLRDMFQQVQVARRAVEATMLPQRAAAARLNAARAELSSLEARIAADRAKYGETQDTDPAALTRTAGQLERAATVLTAEADVLAHQRALATAEAKPTSDTGRSKEIDTANKQLAASRTALEKARTAAHAESDVYSPFSPTYPSTSTGRRKALAEWITGRSNPLTARVAVNHIWSRHFYAPLVATVTDFGRSGAKPTHPELLDWLSVELMDNGWRMKHVHRLIVTSAAYRRTSSPHDRGREHGDVEVADNDSTNRWLSRMNVGRMEAEVVRDSLLYVAGRLDSKMGGQELENTDALKTFRRSLYYSVYPEQGGKSSLGELFDAPDALECYRRTRSIVPQQALALTNSDFVHQISSTLATLLNRSGAQPATDNQQFVEACFERILSRPPKDAELKLCCEAIDRQRELLEKTNAADAIARARESIVRALFNHNDFITIR